MKRHKVLIVDDEEPILHSLERLLRREPYELLCATSGPQALEMLEREPVSLVISDLGMPGMDGLELLARVKERHPEAVRIILTGRADTHSAMRAINEGEVYRFFTKPWNDDELRLTLRQTLHHFELVREANRMLTRLRVQGQLLRELESRYPGITEGASEEVFEIPEDLLATSPKEYLERYFREEEGPETERG